MVVEAEARVAAVRELLDQTAKRRTRLRWLLSTAGILGLSALIISGTMTIYYVDRERDIAIARARELENFNQVLQNHKIELQQEKDAAEGAAKQAREAELAAEKAAETLRRSLPLVASGFHSSISREGWLVEDGKPIRQITEDPVRLATYAPDGKMFAVVSGRFGEKVYVGRPDQNDRVIDLKQAAYSIAFSPDGKYLTVADISGMVGLWDTSSVQIRVEVQTLQVGISSAAFSPDGHLLAIGTIHGKIMIFEAPIVALRKEIDVSKGVFSIAFSADQKRLLVGLLNETWAVINLENGRIESMFSGPVRRM